MSTTAMTTNSSDENGTEKRGEVPEQTDNIGISTTAPVESDRYCWVCFATDDDDRRATWVQPCKCIGSTKWVHHTCLSRWIDEKQKGNPFRRVVCPQCQTEYIIVFPSIGTTATVLEGLDNMCKKMSPFFAAGVAVGCTYWSAVTYGAISVLQVSMLTRIIRIIPNINVYCLNLQVAGHKEGLEMMEGADPLVLLIVLPAIPVCLVLGRLVRWDDMILRFIQRRIPSSRKYPLLSLILPLP